MATKHLMQMLIARRWILYKYYYSTPTIRDYILIRDYSTRNLSTTFRLHDKDKEKPKERMKKKKEDDESDSDDDDDKEKKKKATTPTIKKSLISYLKESDEFESCPEALPANDGVSIVYKRGLPEVSVPLPSRREVCRFTLRPIANTAGDLVAMLRREDGGIDRVTLHAADGTRIAAATTIENLLAAGDFHLTINDVTYEVKVPPLDHTASLSQEKLGDVRHLVHQLYSALHLDEHKLQRERELLAHLERLRLELQPLEAKRLELDAAVGRRTNALTWLGLGAMSIQFGILARLTWWEYSWDIMEPVTYFVTYGTAMAAYAYFVLTKQEYVLPDVKDRQHLVTLHKRARKLGLDLAKYNRLKDQVRFLEKDLRRLQDPKLPVNFLTSHQTNTTIDKLKKLVKLKS